MIVMARWTARIVGSLIVGLLILFAVGQGFDPTQFHGIELGMFVALLTALVGMVVLWWHEGIGGTISLAGMIAFYGLNFAASGEFPGGPVFPVCFLPGLLAITSAWGDRSNQHRKET